ncbi:transposable element Tcb2 transposase [Trichonephila clavipes]|uniref:Transposable element Tcb2 transposase n=1 Tax=Trichonephila clavipes TaxID=2585209 RepID=A0A8X6UWL3_TRICX|nr:transposable element Tcb2 transposase [Trichonephila clavipes]
MGFWNRRPTPVPLLTARHKALRLACAREHRHWTIHDYTPFHLKLAALERGIVQAGGGSVMVWSVCSRRDMEPLIRLDTTLTGDRYEHSSEFRHFCWAPKCPDLNIMEHIWNALQSAVQKRSPPLLSSTDLWTVLQDSWCQLPSALLQTLIEFMPRHVAAFLRARRGPTKY